MKEGDQLPGLDHLPPETAAIVRSRKIAKSTRLLDLDRFSTLPKSERCSNTWLDGFETFSSIISRRKHRFKWQPASGDKSYTRKRFSVTGAESCMQR